jgi:hypothetical protein
MDGSGGRGESEYWRLAHRSRQRRRQSLYYIGIWAPVRSNCVSKIPQPISQAKQPRGPERMQA